MQSTREAQTTVRSSLAPHAVLLMHPHGLTALEKASVKADLAIYCLVLGVSG